MNLQKYRALQHERLSSQTRYRARCNRCTKPPVTCYCSVLRPFHAPFEFVILIHRDEARRAIATGRMAHLCLANSRLYEGIDFTNHEGVNAILGDPARHAIVLFPGPGAIDVSQLASPRELLPADKRIAIFVIDGTWSQARKMRRLSKNLAALPHIAFSPIKPSGFRVRKQPQANCYSTIEAIHYLIDNLARPTDTSHENLLTAFEHMVDQQVVFRENHSARHNSALKNRSKTRTLLAE